MRLLVLVDHQDSPLGQSYVGTNGIHIRILPKSKSMLDCATQDVASNAVTKDLGNDVIFSSANGSVPWPKGKGVLGGIVCVFHGCRFYNTCNILKWDLMGLVFVFKLDNNFKFKSLMKSHEVSLILMVQ